MTLSGAKPPLARRPPAPGTAKPFLIAGLPRCRTAWLAAVCNTVPGALCMHEPLIKLARWQDIGSLFAGQNGYSHVGISDHAMSFHLGEIMDLLPAAQVLVVLRADYEVAESLARINPGPPPVPYIELIRRRLSGIEASDRVKIVQFMDLGAAGMVYECLEHLMPGAEIDQRKIATMQALNIQARMDLSRQRADRALRQGRVPGILGHDVVAELQKTA